MASGYLHGGGCEHEQLDLDVGTNMMVEMKARTSTAGEALDLVTAATWADVAKCTALRAYRGA